MNLPLPKTLLWNDEEVDTSTAHEKLALVTTMNTPKALKRDGIWVTVTRTPVVSELFSPDIERHVHSWVGRLRYSRTYDVYYLHDPWDEYGEYDDMGTVVYADGKVSRLSHGTGYTHSWKFEIEEHVWARAFSHPRESVNDV